jgi:hypothetical protein
MILTCAHVVSGALSGGAITIQWRNQHDIEQVFTAELRPEDFAPNPYPDLALLHIPLQDHPWVQLDTSIELADQLYGYGYTQERADSVTFEYEGPGYEDDPRHVLWKLKGGQAEPGYSGHHELRGASEVHDSTNRGDDRLRLEERLIDINSPAIRSVLTLAYPF